MNTVARARAILKRARIKPNLTELKLQYFLDTYYPGRWIYNGGQIIICGMVPDFVNTNSKKAFIEFIGRRDVPKHSDEELKEREKCYNSFGFKVLYLFSEDIKDENHLILRMTEI